MARKKRVIVKKKRKQQGQYSLRDVQLAINQGNYLLAHRKFTNSRTKEGEEEKAFKLKLDLYQKLGLALFEEHDYKKVTNLLVPVINGIRKEFPEQDLSPLMAIAGVSYLYQASFSNAVSYLKALCHETSSATMGFYYLLAGLFLSSNKYKNWESFEQDQAFNSWQMMEEDRKQYLKFIFLLQQDKLEAAGELLQNMRHQSHSHQANLAAIKSALLETDLSLELSKKVKPLYKVLSNQPLEESEMVPLERLPELETLLRQVNATSKFQKVSERLRQLDSNQNTLNYKELEEMLRLIPEKHQPHVVYNQAALLYNQGLDNTFEALQPLLKSHTRQLLSVPEGGFLYLSVISFDADPFRISQVWKDIQNYLYRFGTSLTAIQQTNFSWLLYDALQSLGAHQLLSYQKQLLRMVEGYPLMIGLKWWLFLDRVMLPNRSVPKEVLDIFNQPLSESTQITMVKKLENSLSIFDPELLSLAFEKVFDLPLPDFGFVHKGIIENLEGALSKAVEIGIHPSARVVLDCIHAISKYIFKNRESFDAFEESYGRLRQLHLKMLDFFNENYSGSTYLKAFQQLESGSLVEEILNTAFEEENIEYLPKLLDDFTKKYDVEILVDQLIDELDDTHFTFDLTEGIANILMKLPQEVESEKQPAFQFGKKYFKQTLKYKCSCTNDFFNELIDELLFVSEETQNFNVVTLVLIGYGKDIEKTDYEISSATTKTFFDNLLKVIKAMPSVPDDLKESINYASGILKKNDKTLKGLKKTIGKLKGII